MVVINTKAILLHGLLRCLLVTAAISCKVHVSGASDSNDINSINGSSNVDDADSFSAVERQLRRIVDDALNHDTYNIINGVAIRRVNDSESLGKLQEEECEDRGRSVPTSFDDYVQNRYERYARTHVISINVPETARFFKFATGKSSFLTGFGMGFLAFGLKKLLLPMFIGAQIVKSILIAMFLPSILGSLGKLATKGLSHASSLSGSSGHQQPPIEDFDFKDTGTPYNVEGTQDDYGTVAAQDYNFPVATTTTSTATQQGNSRFGNDGYYQKVSYIHPQSDNYYFRRPTKQHDYKVFHKIPNSSLLLTTYDPFYSPLLSRLDSVFQQLGLGDGKGLQVEKCRERLVCLMYANPAKYAPYSNLVSAQLSRELNELRKPSSDNPEILRFFRYMRAAKDGQDGEACTAHTGCPSLQADKPSPAMLTTFNDINKLVQARRMH